MKRAPPGIVIATLVLAAGGCSPTSPDGNDLFRVAADGVPGGALLSVWPVPDADDEAFFAGGLVGVADAAIAASGLSAGRLVRYRAGVFTTVCRTDAPLWWVHGARAANGDLVVYAAGERGKIVRRVGEGGCETLDPSSAFAAGASLPTFWGLLANGRDDVTFVGGALTPTGPQNVVLRYDGTAFHLAAGIPADAQGLRFYKIARTASGSLRIAAERGTVLRGTAGSDTWARVPATVRRQDATLFTVSCTGESCWYVGGAGSGLLLREQGGAVAPSAAMTDDLPGLSGIWAQDEGNTWVVGSGGLTLWTDGARTYRPALSPTPMTLHAVAGARGRVFAAGGALGDTSAAQAGVVLVRGDTRGTYTFDGTVYTARGTLRNDPSTAAR